MNVEAVLNTFLVESRDLLHEMEQATMQLEQDPSDKNAINAIFRAAHTLKGSSGLFGLEDVVHFTHALESCLEPLRKGTQGVSAELMAILLECCDFLGNLLNPEASGHMNPRLRSWSEALLRRLGRATGRTFAPAAAPSGGAAPVAAEEAQGGVRSHNERWHLSLRFGRDALRNGMDPSSFLHFLEKLGAVEQVVLVDSIPAALSDMDPESCYLGFEIALRSDASQVEIEKVFEFAKEDMTLRLLAPRALLRRYGELLKELPEGPERIGQIWRECSVVTQEELDILLGKPKDAPPAPTSSTAAVAPSGGSAAERRREDSNFVRVDSSKLDRLINLVGELVVAVANTALVAQQAGDNSMAEAAKGIERLVDEVRESALRMRMVQIGETFGRFKRVVRDVSQQLNKTIELVVSGGDTELDKAMVERLVDPLMHMVRNAIDHGIEPTAVRLARGKPAKGTLRLNAYHESGCVVVEVGEDGAGLDRQKILRRARERGLLRPDHQPSDQEIYHFIFEAGFSTAEKVTDLSGRGVGMDVVKRNIEGLHGTIELDTKEGQGTTFRIRLPLTLAIINGFLARVGPAHYIIPLDSVVECREFGEGDKGASGERRYINLRGEVLPFVVMRDLFRISHGARSDGRAANEGEEGKRKAKKQHLIVVSAHARKAGIVVDDLLGRVQSVIKPSGALFEHLRGISGYGVLGDGQVALILDIAVLLQRAANHESSVVGVPPSRSGTGIGRSSGSLA